MRTLIFSKASFGAESTPLPMWHSVGDNQLVKKAVSIRTITLALGILVALFIFLTLVSRNFPITLSKGATPTFQILSGFLKPDGGAWIRVFAELF